MPRLVGSVVGSGMRLAAVGVLIGIAGSIASAHLVASFLYGVTPDDPWMLGLGAAIVCAAAVVASIAPALSARVDPMAALRED